MHQLVDPTDVKKMYRKACLAVHPDKQMGTDNENLSKLIFMELNEVRITRKPFLKTALFRRPFWRRSFLDGPFEDSPFLDGPF